MLHLYFILIIYLFIYSFVYLFIYSFIKCRSNGATFDAKLHNDNLHPLPKEGDVVTFSYVSVDEKGNPIRPKIVRVRHDATWHNPSQLAQSTSGILQLFYLFYKCLFVCLFFLV